MSLGGGGRREKDERQKSTSIKSGFKSLLVSKLNLPPSPTMPAWLAEGPPALTIQFIKEKRKDKGELLYGKKIN